jgi:iron complex transport system permease protein
VTAALAASSCCLVLISLGIGPVWLSPLAVAEALFGGGSDVSQVIVREIRLPRTLLALAIGAILGCQARRCRAVAQSAGLASLFGAPQSAPSARCW